MWAIRCVVRRAGREVSDSRKAHPCRWWKVKKPTWWIPLHTRQNYAGRL